MIISHKHKFIYFKAPKVAGTSTEYFLENFCGDDDLVTSIVPVESLTHTPRNVIQGLKRHTSPNDLFTNYSNHFQLDVIKNYRLVCGTRNSWDRVVSSFCMGQKRRSTDFNFKDWLLTLHKPRCIYNFSLVNNCCLITDWLNQESLEKDLRAFCDSLNICHSNTKLICAKKYNNKHYTEYYDDETRDFVAKKYAIDIEFFGYKFGN